MKKGAVPAMVKGLVRTFERIERQKAARHDFAEIPNDSPPTEGKRLLAENPMSDILRKQYHVQPARVTQMHENGHGTIEITSEKGTRRYDIFCADIVHEGAYVYVIIDETNSFMDKLQILGLTRSEISPVRKDKKNSNEKI